jgi:hypothetical protein
MKNYLGKTKEVKAPVRWKSSPDAPDTQLAYITQPEIDMLVQANIHGSMNGKPNMGPKGIISLDGMGAEDTAIGEKKIRDRPFSPNVISSGGSPHGGFTGSGTGSGQGSGNINYGQGNVDPGLQQAVNAQASNTQATLPPSLGFQPKDPMKKTVQDYLNQGITNPNQLAAQSMLDANVYNLAGKMPPDFQGIDSGNLTTTQGSGIIKDDDDTEIKIDGQDDSDDTETKTEKDKDGKTKYFIKGVGEVSGKMYGAYRRLIGQGVPEKDIINAIKGLGAAEEKFAAENLTKFSDKKLTDFLPINLLMSALKTPAYENKFLGSAGAANILNKLNSITGKTAEETAKLKQEYVNKIISKNKGASQMFGPDLVKGITPEQFEEVLTGANIGNKNFDKNYYGTQADFYKLNQPATSGGLAELASLDAQATNDPFLKQQIFDARNQLNVMGKDMFGNTQGGGGGVNVPPPATDQTDPNNTYTYPDYNLIRQYRRDEGFTPNYLGGPEQMQLAGGYYDPTAQQFLFGGSGYGGSTNYIGDPQQYFSQGGMVDGKGLSGFKMKGF